MYIFSNNTNKEVGLPAPKLGALILGAGVASMVTDNHYRELAKSLYMQSAIKRGDVSVEYQDNPAEALPEVRGVRAVSTAGGWWRVYVNGHEITDKAVRKAEAERIAAEYQ